MMRLSTVFVVLAALAAFALAQNRDFGAIVSNLAALQHPSGGFVSESGEPTLGATSNALFLANLYGITSQIDSAAVPGFIRACEKHDDGYGQNPSAEKADMQSTRDAVFAFLHLDLEVPNDGLIRRYIDSLKDPQTGRFAPYAGASTTLHATALALETLRELGDDEVIASVKEPLSALLAEKDNGVLFDVSGMQPLFDEASAVLIAQIIGYEFNAEAHARSIIAMQNTNGGFPMGQAGSQSSVLSCVLAAKAINVLSSIENKRFASGLNNEALRQFLSVIPYSLKDAADAHKTIALTNFPDLLRTKVSYEASTTSPPIRGKTIIEGSAVRPVLHVGAFGQSHVGLDVSFTAVLGDRTETFEMPFLATRYATETLLDVGEYLGPVSATFNVKLDIPEVGSVVFALDDSLSVGYGIDVVASAKHELSGRDIMVGDVVSSGTTFDFEVSFVTAESSSTTLGDFDLLFEVLDASAIAIHSETRDCSAGGDLLFAYALTSGALPPGGLYFRFSIAGADGTKHSMEMVQYQFTTPLVATRISVGGADAGKFRLGTEGTVVMTPAAFSDLATPEPLVDASAARNFYMDVVSQSGVAISSTAGTVSADGSVTFSLEIDDSFDALGRNSVRFRFEAVDGKSFMLSNFDSDAGEVLEEEDAVAYEVDSELTIAVAPDAIARDLKYGDRISFPVEVVDALTGLTLKRGREGNVYLVLNHKDAAGEPFTSVKEPAQVVDGTLAIDWHVDPNAVRGDAFFTLVAEDPAGGEHLLVSESGDKLVFPVTIGGEIDVEFNGVSKGILHSRGTLFAVEFALSCNNEELTGAKLSVEVGDSDEAIAVAGSDNRYSVSWMVPHHAAPSGEYEVRVYRDVDRARAAEIDAARLKAARQEQRERELAGGAVVDDVTVEKTPVDPLFTRVIKHEAPVAFSLPFRTQWLALAFFGLVFYRVARLSRSE